MKPWFLPLFLLAVTLATQAQAPPPRAAAGGPAQTYSAMLAELKTGNTDVDFYALRMAYAATEEYRGDLASDPDKDPMFEALNAQKWNEALELANRVLERTYVDLDGHFAAFVANNRLGHSDRAGFHKAVFSGLLHSLKHDGDGSSPEKAIPVIFVSEEYVFARVNRLEPKQHSLIHQDGHDYDKMVMVETDTKAEETLYFNVDLPLKRADELLKSGK